LPDGSGELHRLSIFEMNLTITECGYGFVRLVAVPRIGTRGLTGRRPGRYRRCMPQSILVFDFGANEDAAQQARHKIDAWKQGFRLGNKMTLKFDREEPSEKGADAEAAGAEKKPAAKKTAAKADKGEKAQGAARVRLLVKLNFSDHEKLTYQRWLDRIPAEEPFKSAKGETLRSGDPALAKTAELFESLD